MFRPFSLHEFLLLHPAVLKPNLDLSLGQIEHVGELDAPFPRDVRVHDEFAFEPARLRPRVGNAFLPAARSQLDDGGAVFVRMVVVVVGEGVRQAGDVRRQDGGCHAAGSQRGSFRQT